MIKVEATPPSIGNFRYGAVVVHYVDYIETGEELVSPDSRFGVLRGLGGRNLPCEILFAVKWEGAGRKAYIHPNNIRYVAQSQDGLMYTDLGLAVPTIHRNGTSADVIKENIRVARDQLSKAHSSLLLAAPNSRDYYVQDEGAFDIARTQHSERLQRIETTISEIEEIYAAVRRQEK